MIQLTGYRYRLVNVITFGLALSDHIKHILQYKKFASKVLSQEEFSGRPQQGGMLQLRQGSVEDVSTPGEKFTHHFYQKARSFYMKYFFC